MFEGLSEKLSGIFDALTRRDAVEIVRRLRAAVERAAPRRRP